MIPRILSILLLVFVAVGPAPAQEPAHHLAQNKIRTETIRPPKPGEQTFTNPGRLATPDAGKLPEIIANPARLPPAVARTRDRILAAARSGELMRLFAVMQEAPTLPVFSFADDRDPIAFWRTNYPDSEGVEALSILLNILEAPFVHVDVGTPQEIYVWPYFARIPLKTLTPAQKAELFRIVTGADYKDMVEFGVYSFYRLGIAPDGTWQFFVAGD
jgi:hypothetical protein